MPTPPMLPRSGIHRVPPTPRSPCSPAAASGRPSDVEAIPGVVDAISGFAGGTVRNPSYEQVVRGGTGHVESIQVIYDPARISYAQLVRRFLRTIDPTDSGGQYCDCDDNYHTAIFAL